LDFSQQRLCLLGENQDRLGVHIGGRVLVIEQITHISAAICFCSVETERLSGVGESCVALQ
jgi:hypothetical protein